MTTQRIKLPITGMTCATCAFTVERALRVYDGVSEVYVNRAPGYASIVYDPKQIGPTQLVKQVYNAGYGVEMATMEFGVVSAANEENVQKLEELLMNMPGISSVDVNLKTEKVTISYISGTVQHADAVKALEDAGYSIFELPEAEDGSLQLANGSVSILLKGLANKFLDRINPDK